MEEEMFQQLFHSGVRDSSTMKGSGREPYGHAARYSNGKPPPYRPIPAVHRSMTSFQTQPKETQRKRRAKQERIQRLRTNTAVRSSYGRLEMLGFPETDLAKMDPRKEWRINRVLREQEAGHLARSDEKTKRSRKKKLPQAKKERLDSSMFFDGWNYKHITEEFALYRNGYDTLREHLKQSHQRVCAASGGASLSTLATRPPPPPSSRRTEEQPAPRRKYHRSHPRWKGSDARWERAKQAASEVAQEEGTEEQGTVGSVAARLMHVPSLLLSSPKHKLLQTQREFYERRKALTSRLHETLKEREQDRPATFRRKFHVLMHEKRPTNPSHHVLVPENLQSMRDRAEIERLRVRLQLYEKHRWFSDFVMNITQPGQERINEASKEVVDQVKALVLADRDLDEEALVDIMVDIREIKNTVRILEKLCKYAPLLDVGMGKVVIDRIKTNRE